MADVTENLISILQTSTTLAGYVADRIIDNELSDQPAGDYITLRLAQKVYEHHLNSAAGEAPRAVMYDLECCSKDIARANRIGDAVRDLFPRSGTFGDQTIKGAFVNDQSDDYIPLNSATFEGVTVCALQVEVMP